MNKGSNYKAKTKGVKYEAGTKHNDFIQAETQNAKYEAETKHTDILQAKTRGAKYKADQHPPGRDQGRQQPPMTSANVRPRPRAPSTRPGPAVPGCPIFCSFFWGGVGGLGGRPVGP